MPVRLVFLLKLVNDLMIFGHLLDLRAVGVVHEVEAVASRGGVAENLVTCFVLEDQMGVLISRFVDIIIDCHIINWEDQLRGIALPIEVLLDELRWLRRSICSTSFLHRSLRPHL